MWFDFGRQERLPTQYEPNKTPVTVDVLEAGLILAFVIVALSFYIILLGKRGKRLGSLFIRITTSLILGAIIMVGNFGQEWEVGHIKTKTPYRIGTGEEIHADIGVKIGFRSVNVTLKADTTNNHDLRHEVINYNERFEWTWDQGRFGFGPYAGRLQRSFREAQYKGLPLPILWVVDYFVFDGEGLRFGRFYRTAGWYSHIVLWAAFPCWVLTNILFLSVVRYGVNFLAISGILQLVSCLVWGVVRNPLELSIPFDSGELKLKFGSSFYVTLVGGIISCILAFIIHVCNIYWPEDTADFFAIDPLSDYDELHLSPTEAKILRPKNQDMIPMMELGPTEEPEEKDDVVVFKRRRTLNFGKKQRITLRHMNAIEEMPVYSNVMNSVSEETPLHPPPSTSRDRPPMLPPKRKK